MDAPILTLNHSNWQFSEKTSINAIEALEAGKVLHFPHLAFQLSKQEQALLKPSLVDPKRKNISFSINKRSINGVADLAFEATVQALLRRYYNSVERLMDAFFLNTARA